MFNSIEEIEQFYKYRQPERVRIARINLAVRALEKRNQEDQLILEQGIHFAPLEEISAVPCLAGIITTLSLDKLRKRFYEPSILRVSRRMQAVYESDDPDMRKAFMVVVFGGLASAVTPQEARVYGLSELEEWIPDGLPVGYDSLNPDR